MIDVLICLANKPKKDKLQQPQSLIPFDFDIENIKTGYICKDCKHTIVGYYLIYHEKRYFRCKCKCFKWLVQSTRLNQTFNKELSVFFI